MENLEIYNQIKEVPEEARKKIGGGRLKGMTDIKPMWRIQKLTEIFGVCGFGWKAPIKNKEIIEGANGEKIAIVDIDLYVKIDGKWSDPIEGTGGSSFVAKESNGYYTSDECFKMAYTDAISVACKSLGMGADVYWGDSKYNKAEGNKNKKNTTEKVDNLDKKITEKEATAIYAIMTRKGVDVVPNLKKNYNITNTKDLTRRQYISILTVMKKMPDKTTTTESQKDATATPNEDKKQTTNNMKE